MDKDGILNIELNQNLSFYTSKTLYNEYCIILELLKKHENETDYISVLYRDNHGCFKAVLDYGKDLVEKDIIYYINELLEFIKWRNGEPLVIRELIGLWSQAYTFVSYDEIEDNRRKSMLLVTGIDMIFSITKIYFMLMKRDKRLFVKVRRTFDSKGRGVTVNFASKTRKK